MDIWYDSIHHDDKHSAVNTDQNLELEIWQGIERGLQSPSEATGHRLKWWNNNFLRLAVAAVLVLGGVFLTNRYFADETQIISGVPAVAMEHLNIVTNRQDSSLTVDLSDGSKCWLAAGSSLFYPSVFEESNRIVYLKGEGYFEVEKDAGRPFLVYADNIVTKVVGTSFTVKKLKGTSNIEVAVYSGKVIVEKIKGQPGNSLRKSVVLTPNKKVTYLLDDDAFLPGLIDKPALLNGYSNTDQTEIFAFKEMAVSEILTRFEKAYDVKFIVSSDQIKNCIVTADMSLDPSLFSKLEILCAAINANFEVRGGDIFITGQGCEK
ncbi:hypothetical protein Dfri01_55100 [Dyadobacter frigoris]|nr:hypothetical protein Dfri01_55100 [Dyadobacter frigoris]